MYGGGSTKIKQIELLLKTMKKLWLGNKQTKGQKIWNDSEPLSICYTIFESIIYRKLNYLLILYLHDSCIGRLHRSKGVGRTGFNSTVNHFKCILWNVDDTFSQMET